MIKKDYLKSIGMSIAFTFILLFIYTTVFHEEEAFAVKMSEIPRGEIKNDEISESKRKDIEKLFELTMTGALIDTYMNNFMNIFKSLLVIDRNTEEKKLIEEMTKIVSEVIIQEYPEFLKEMIPVYDKYFTHEEIKKMIEFNKTPLGKKIIKVTPQLTNESMELGKNWGASLAPTMMDKFIKKGIKFKNQ